MMKNNISDHFLWKALMDFYQVKDLEEVFLCPTVFWAGHVGRFEKIPWLMTVFSVTKRYQGDGFPSSGMIAGYKNVTW